MFTIKDKNNTFSDFHFSAFGLKAKSQEYSLKFDEGFVAGCYDMILSTFLEMDKVV